MAPGDTLRCGQKGLGSCLANGSGGERCLPSVESDPPLRQDGVLGVMCALRGHSEPDALDSVNEEVVRCLHIAYHSNHGRVFGALGGRMSHADGRVVPGDIRSHLAHIGRSHSPCGRVACSGQRAGEFGPCRIGAVDGAIFLLNGQYISAWRAARAGYGRNGQDFLGWRRLRSSGRPAQGEKSAGQGGARSGKVGKSESL